MSALAMADMVSQAKTLIDRPIDVVWPHLLNQEAWMKDFVIERIAGERDRVGEVRKVLPTVDPSALGLAEVHPFYFKTLKITPYREFVYKAYTPHRGGEYSFTGVEVLRLTDVHGASVVTFDLYLEFQSERMSEAALGEFVKQGKEGGAALWARNFQRLGALVAGGGGPSNASAS